MDIALCAGWRPFSPTDLDDVVARVGAALRADGHVVEEIRIPTGSTDEGRLGATLAWRLAPIGGDLAVVIGSPAVHARHPRKVAWVLEDADVDSAALQGAGAVFASSDELATSSSRRAGVAVQTLLPTDAYLAARLVGAIR
jgi:hypothetical protein